MRRKLSSLTLTAVFMFALAAPSLLAQATPSGMPQGGKSGMQQKGREMHPAIHKAIQQLHEAKDTLKTAPDDFKGYKNNALKAIDDAIEQLKQAAQVQQK